MLYTRTTSAALLLSAASVLVLAALPAQAQTALPFTGDFTGGQTQSIPLTATTEEDRGAFTSTNASFGFDRLTTHYFVSFVSTPTSYTYSLTPGTTSTFTATATDGSTLSGVFVSLTGGFISANVQTYTGMLSITSGTGAFTGATGHLTSTGSANGDDSVDMFRSDGTINLPAPVPEASTPVSLGLLLALGVGGMVVAARRKKGASSL